MLIALTYKGRPITKKNSSRIFRTKSGVPFITPSAQYKQYENDCIWQTPTQARIRVSNRVNVKCIYYMPTHAKTDLCNLLGATCDILIKAGVIEDDNSRIIVGHDGSRVLYDKENPRVEIVIEPIGGTTC